MQHKHVTLTVTVTLKNGTVITDELFQVDTVEKWLDLTSYSNPIAFEDCASVVDASGKDMLKDWRNIL